MNVACALPTELTRLDKFTYRVGQNRCIFIENLVQVYLGVSCLFSGLQSDRELLGSTEARSSFQKSPAYKFGWIDGISPRRVAQHRRQLLQQPHWQRGTKGDVSDPVTRAFNQILNCQCFVKGHNPCSLNISAPELLFLMRLLLFECVWLIWPNMMIYYHNCRDSKYGF